MSRKLIRGNLILPDKVEKNGFLVIKEGQIVEIIEASQAGQLANSPEVIDYRGCWVSPGLIDVHLHGARGKEAMDGEVESSQGNSETTRQSAELLAFSRPP